MSAVTAVAAALPAFADTPADRATTAFSVLPPGNGDVWGPTARHASDQIKLYEGLESVAANGTLGRPGTAAPHYKQAGFTPQRVVREERPAPGVLIRWDQWGVPYISAPDIRRVSFGAGWAQAQSRLLILEALRTLGRGGVVESLTATRPPGAGGRPLVNYTDKELETGFDELFAEAGEDTDDLRDGTDGYLAGINAWLAANRNRIPGSMRLPFGLGRIGTPKPWKRADAAAAAMVINDVFGVGGGGELGAARALRALQDRLGTQAGMALYEDLRIPDPGATTHTATPSPYPVFAAKEGVERTGDAGPLDPAAIAMPDATTPVSPADMPEAPHMSNYVALSGERTATRRPLIIGGPQMGYYSPEIVMESVLRTPEFEARGISVPGLGPILIAGRTAEYAWTPTSGGTDATDVRAELLCEPDGSTPTRASRHYMYKGECRPMTRPPGAKANTAWRTVHGPVLSWGTVDGKPVGFAHQRYDRLSTPVSVIGFYRMQSGQTKTAEAFVDAARTVTLSLNLGYANANEVAYQHAGRYPVRAPGTRNDLPVWGTGEWEWRGRLDPRLQPFEIRPAKGYTMSWNNVPAPGWTSEGWWGGNAVHRADTLEDRFKHARGMTVDEVVKHHQDAATVDVEAFTLMPSIERILGNSAAPTPAAGQARAMLHAWADKGAHRRDANRDFLIDAAAATLIASLSDAMLDRTYRARLGEEAVRVIPVTDDRPGLDGSAYATSWASPLARELDRAAGVASSPAGVPAMCGGGDAEACRAVVWDALGAAYTKTRQSQLPWLRNTPTRWRSAASPILFLPVITLPKAMRWQNRPTFEQVSAFE